MTKCYNKVENSVELKLDLCWNCTCANLKTRKDKVIKWCEEYCVSDYDLNLENPDKPILAFVTKEDFLKFVLAKPFDYELIDN